MCGPVHHRTEPVMAKATTGLVYNVVRIYAPGHARYNEVDLYIKIRPAVLEKSLKAFSTFSSGCHLVQQSRMVTQGTFL